jgi:hypothetical protein
MAEIDTELEKLTKKLNEAGLSDWIQDVHKNLTKRSNELLLEIKALNEQAHESKIKMKDDAEVKRLTLELKEAKSPYMEVIKENELKLKFLALVR